MNVKFDQYLVKCGQDIKAHCERTGLKMQQILIQMGHEKLLQLWCWEGETPLKYHDIGKFKNSNDLNKRHMEQGAELFRKCYDKSTGKTSERIFYSIGIDLCRYHHENWNGQGNVSGFSKTDIPFVARICAVANAWDHLEHSGLNVMEIQSKIEKNKEILFDPEIVDAVKVLLLN
ncbi:MAG: hypothetical protein RR310_03345 [Eubacterium sp.]